MSKAISILVLSIFLSSNSYSQVSIKTNLFSTIACLPSYGLKVQSGKMIFGLNDVYGVCGHIKYVRFYQNTHHYKVYENRFNPNFQFGYAFYDNFSLIAGYGFINYQADEKKCINPTPINNAIFECTDIIQKKYDAKMNYLSLTPNIIAYKSKRKLYFELVFKAAFAYFFKDENKWENLAVPKLNVPNKAAFYRENSFLVLPNIELNVGYKI